jgi:hypothetical protein
MNESASGVLLLGLLLGMKHATEADHLAAVATLVARRQTMAQTLHQGLAWGIGHTLTLMAFGGALLLLGGAVPDALARGLETAVGLTLIALGLNLLWRLARERLHAQAHRHAGAHGAGPAVAVVTTWPLRALAVGMMHGLAGSAALMLLGMQAAPSVAVGLGYILLFGIGSIAGMAALSVVIAWPLRASAQHLVRLHVALTAAVGLFSCAVGIWLVVEVGYLRSLFA